MSIQEDLVAIGFTREHSRVLLDGFVRAGLCDAAGSAPKDTLLYQEQIIALEYCLRVFGDSGKSRAWLCKGLQVLKEDCPLVLLASQEGVSQVMEKLVQIDYGFFA